jgi:hypothetical protein
MGPDALRYEGRNVVRREAEAFIIAKEKTYSYGISGLYRTVTILFERFQDKSEMTEPVKQTLRRVLSFRTRQSPFRLLCATP